MSEGLFQGVVPVDPAEKSGIRKLCCQGCGATLPVDDSVRFITCNYCHSSLEVIRHADTTYTQLLGELDERTKRIEKKVDVIELRAQLDDLDESWKSFRDSVSSKDNQGNLQPPGMTSVFGVSVGVVGFFCFVGVAAYQASGILTVFVILMGLCVAVLVWNHGEAKVRDYEAMFMRYEMRRRELKQKLALHGGTSTARDAG